MVPKQVAQKKTTKKDNKDESGGSGQVFLGDGSAAANHRYASSPFGSFSIFLIVLYIYSFDKYYRYAIFIALDY